MSEQFFARIVDGRAFEIVPFDPAGRFPEDWTWASCPADTQQGATYNAKTGKFTNPAAPPPPEPAPPPEPVYRTLMSPIRFKAQFALSEQIAIKIARAYVAPDPANAKDAKLTLKLGLDILFDNLADLVAMGKDIDVADASVIAGLGLLETATLIGKGRAAEIGKGLIEATG